MNDSNNINLVLKGRLYDLSTPLVMAIVNATDDSFYPSSRNVTDDDLKRHVANAVAQGADIIDVGGCSTRPDAPSVSEQQELERVSHAFAVLRSVAGDIPTSIDTFRSSVARLAVVEYGCDIINDISAFTLDERLFDTVVQLQKPYILTHYPVSNSEKRPNAIPKTPEVTPQDAFLASVLQFFASKTEELRSAGFNNDIIIDPGFGFGKSVEQNFSLLGNLSLLGSLHEPILAGLSRKSMIYRTLGISADDALNGTTVLNTVSLLNGAHILRVHDVREAVQARTLIQNLKPHYI